MASELNLKSATHQDIFNTFKRNTPEQTEKLLPLLIAQRMDIVEHLFTSRESAHRRFINHSGLPNAACRMFLEGSIVNPMPALARTIATMPIPLFDENEFKEVALCRLLSNWPRIQAPKDVVLGFLVDVTKTVPTGRLFTVLAPYAESAPAATTAVTSALFAVRAPIEAQKAFRCAVLNHKDAMAVCCLTDQPLDLVLRMVERPFIKNRMPKLWAAVEAMKQKSLLQQIASSSDIAPKRKM